MNSYSFYPNKNYLLVVLRDPNTGNIYTGGGENIVTKFNSDLISLKSISIEAELISGIIHNQSLYCNLRGGKLIVFDMNLE